MLAALIEAGGYAQDLGLAPVGSRDHAVEGGPTLG
jgi:hypothetical protein